MMRQWYPIARVAALATAALLFAAGPSLAQRGGGGHGGGGHGGGGHGGGGHGGGGGFHAGSAPGGFHHGGVHDGFHHHNGSVYFYGFGLGYYPWYYGGYYPGYYDNWYYGDYARPAYSPGYYASPPVQDNYANTYSYPSVAPAPDTYPVPNENAIYMRVQVPPDAEVWFEDQKTTQKGPVRFFESPPVAPGRKYVYHIKARWTEDGREVEQTREAPVYAGEKFSFDFTKMKDRPPPKPGPAGS